jgi:hypothetical protein
MGAFGFRLGATAYVRADGCREFVLRRPLGRVGPPLTDEEFAEQKAKLLE